MLDALSTIRERVQKADALVLGPGFGRGEGAQAVVRETARAVDVPLVLDADGLNAHAGRIGDLAGRSAPTILTPHAGELGRLLGLESKEIGARRLHHARAAAQQAQAVVVLKGDDTIVARPDGFAAVSPGGGAGPGHGRDRRRAVRRARRAARQGPRPVRRRLCRRLAAPARRPGRRRSASTARTA